MNDLKFRKLRPDEIEVRVGSVNSFGVSLLLYKNARADMNVLDETVGPLNWKREHTSIDGRLYCTVSVYNSETGEWVSKMDVGTESNAEREKGQASDAFKRACVSWGIGRELYSSPQIFIYKNYLKKYRAENGKYKCYDTFSVYDIAYDRAGNIETVKIWSDCISSFFTFTNKKTVAPVQNHASQLNNSTNSNARQGNSQPGGQANNNNPFF